MWAGSRGNGPHASSMGLTLLRLFLEVWLTGIGVSHTMPGEKPVLPDGERIRPCATLSPARAAAEGLDPLACPPPMALLTLSFHLLASTGGKGPWGSSRHLAAFPQNRLTSIPRDPPDSFLHFPPPQRFCGSVRPHPCRLVPLLILHPLPPSLVLSPFRRAGSPAESPAAPLFLALPGSVEGA